MGNLGGLIFPCHEAWYNYCKLTPYQAKLFSPVFSHPCLILSINGCPRVSGASVSKSVKWGSPVCPPHRVWGDLRKCRYSQLASFLPLAPSLPCPLPCRGKSRKSSLNTSLPPSHSRVLPVPPSVPQAYPGTRPQGSSPALFPQAPAWALKATPPPGSLSG